MTPASRPSARVLALLLAVAAVLAVVLAASLLRDGASTTTAPPAGRPASSTSSASPSAADTPVSGLPTVPESRLPREATETLALVRAGGPYPYEQDDGVFGNRERLLPPRPRGYYREYTVETPGDTDRGPRRLVVGAAGDVYWTTDHYASFRQVEVGT